MEASNANIVIYIKGSIGSVGRYGIECLMKMTDHMKQGAYNASITAGTYSGSEELKAMSDNGVIELERMSEAFSIKKISDCEYILIGYDDKGLLYGCFHIIEKLEGSTGALNNSGGQGKSRHNVCIFY